MFTHSKKRMLLFPILIVSLVFIFSFHVTPVSAASTVYVDSVNGNDSSSGTYASPKKTINTAVNVVSSGGTLYVKDGSYKGYSNHNIIINKNMRIVGENKKYTVIDAQNTGNIFLVKTGVSLTLLGLTLKNGSATEGGAIYNDGKLIIENCIFNSNTASMDGGAIKSGKNGLSISHSIFNSNSAPQGGAVSNYIGTMISSYNTFTYNKATLDDGAAILNNRGAAKLNHDIFSYNTGIVSGAVSNAKGSMSLIGCNFVSNFATSGYAGAIQTYYGPLNIVLSQFTGNHAPQGGAILDDHGTLSVKNSKFTGNKATMGYGGAVFNYYGTGIFNNCSFSSNTAKSRGGAINNANANLNINYCSFTVNKVLYGNGGALSNSRGKIKVNSSIFKYNKATKGVSIYNYYGSGSVMRSQIIGSGNQIFNYAGSLNATYNWWGSNSNPSSRVSSGVVVKPWLKKIP